MSYLSPTLRSRADRLITAALVAVACGTTLSSQAYDLTLTAEPGAAVPDGDLSGLASTIVVPGGGAILDLDLDLDLPGVGYGGWNGDLFVLLSHGGVSSILVNRPGRTATQGFGYGDNGLVDVTFDDEAPAGDFHIYQETLGLPGDSNSPITGTWQPDARQVDPLNVVTSHPRSAFLSAFDGMDAEGEWVLLVTDLSTGGRVQLDRWTLKFSFDPHARLPETGHGLLLLGSMAVFGMALTRRRSAGGPIG